MAYRDFLAEEHELFQLFFDAIEEYQNGGLPDIFDQRLSIGAIPERDWPEPVALPGFIPYSVFTAILRSIDAAGSVKEAARRIRALSVRGYSEKMVRAYVDIHGPTMPQDSFWYRHMFFAGYRRTRHTYHATPELWDELQGLEWPGDTPVEALKYLPLPAFALQDPDDTVYTVNYDLLSGKEDTDKLELRIAELKKSGDLKPAVVLHLDRKDSDETLTVDEAVNQSVDTILDNHDESSAYRPFQIIEDASDFRQRIRHNTEKIINVLLYLAGEDDITERVREDVDFVPKRHRRALSGTSYESDLDEEPTEADVGLRMQQAVRKYKEDSAGDSGNGSGGWTMPPHIRRPHPHLYWTGPDRSVPKVKWLGPIAVNMDAKDADESDVPPTEQDIK